MNAHIARRTHENFTRKNLSKLVFHGSDDDASSQQENNAAVLYRTVRETPTRQPLRTQIRLPFRAEPSLLGQSPMQQRVNEAEDDYLFQPVVKKDNFLKEPTEEKAEIRVPRSSLPTTLLFVESEDEEEEENKGPESIRKASGSGGAEEHKEETTFSLENEEGSDREETRAEQTFQKQESSDSEKQAKAEGVSLLQITQKVKKQSAYFEQAVKDNSNPETITNLMFTPLRENTAQIFEVHVYSSLTEKRFQLWMDSLPMMKLLMAAQKSFRPQRTTYQLTTHLENSHQFCQACTITSNLDRSEFSVEAHRSTAPALLATIACGTTLQNSKNLVLYYPAVDPRTATAPRLPKNKPTDSLKQLYQEQREGLVDYLMTTRLQAKEKLDLMKEYGLRSSDKSMEFRGREGELKVVIGKKGSKRYSIIAGPRLSPIQIFALAIVNIETS